MAPFCISPTRIRGPRRSPKRAVKTPRWSETLRIRSTSGLACSAERWEKFSRATSMPASMRRRNMPGLSLAGPIVATILVRFAGRAISGTLAQAKTPHKAECAPCTGRSTARKRPYPPPPLADRPLHLQVDQALQFHPVFHRELAHQIVHKPIDRQAHGLPFAQPALLQVEDLLHADLADRGLMLGRVAAATDRDGRVSVGATGGV